MRIEPIWQGAGFGIRIFDVDLSQLSPLDSRELSALVHRHKIVAIDNQRISDERYVEFASGLGKLVPFNFKNYSATGRPEIMILDNQAHLTGIGGRKVGNMWHSDSSYQNRPLDLTLLLAKTATDPKFGGDTLFVDTQAVLAQLDREILDQLEKCQARHEVLWTYKVTSEDVNQSLRELVDGLRARNGFVLHSCLRVHPFTGMANLNINPGYTTSIEGMSSDESRALMDKVFSTALRSENIYSYQWKTNDLLIWDNRSVWHRASKVECSVARIMHRIGVQEVV